MSVETAMESAVERAADGHPMIHLVCCWPWRALCGERTTGKNLGIDYPEGPYDCLVCDDLAGTPCGIPGCRAWSAIRWRWRSWRSS